MIKLKELLIEGKPLTDDDIKIGDAYKKTDRGLVIDFVYGKSSVGNWTTIEFQFKPPYGNPYFQSVGTGPTESVNSWGKSKKVKINSKQKKIMIKTLEDAIKSKYKGSEETDVVLRDRGEVGSLNNVLSWVKRL